MKYTIFMPLTTLLFAVFSSFAEGKFSSEEDKALELYRGLCKQVEKSPHYRPNDDFQAPQAFRDANISKEDRKIISRYLIEKSLQKIPPPPEASWRELDYVYVGGYEIPSEYMFRLAGVANDVETADFLKTIFEGIDRKPGPQMDPKIANLIIAAQEASKPFTVLNDKSIHHQLDIRLAIDAMDAYSYVGVDAMGAQEAMAVLWKKLDHSNLRIASCATRVLGNLPQELVYPAMLQRATELEAKLPAYWDPYWEKINPDSPLDTEAESKRPAEFYTIMRLRQAYDYLRWNLKPEHKKKVIKRLTRMEERLNKNPKTVEIATKGLALSEQLSYINRDYIPLHEAISPRYFMFGLSLFFITTAAVLSFAKHRARKANPKV